MRQGHVFDATTKMHVEQCCNCGMLFAMPESFREEKLKHRNNHNRRSFYCPNGHAQFFLGETEEQRLKRELEATQRDKGWYERCYKEESQRAEHERRRANGYKGYATRITKRAKAGVCPCCDRSFENLRRHMASQHPQFTPLELENPA